MWTVPGAHIDSRCGGAIHLLLTSGLLGLPGRPDFPGRGAWDRLHPSLEIRGARHKMNHEELLFCGRHL